MSSTAHRSRDFSVNKHIQLPSQSFLVPPWTVEVGDEWLPLHTVSLKAQDQRPPSLQRSGLPGGSHHHTWTLTPASTHLSVLPTLWHVHACAHVCAEH